jgi:tetratricopeptide (TPR) repeat protein
MSDWVFIDLPSNTIKGLAEPEFPYPIRREQMPMYEQLKEDEFPLHFVMDELELYLEEHPNRVERYRKEGGYLFFCAGIDAVIDHCTEPSLHYFKMAIWLRPDDLSARMNCAIALHSLERRDEAMEQYRQVMARGDIHEWWQAWMLSAQVLMAKEEYAKALPLLEEAEKVLPEDNQFWSTLALCREKMQPHCPHCGEELHEKARFCGNCGGKLD